MRRGLVVIEGKEKYVPCLILHKPTFTWSQLEARLDREWKLAKKYCGFD